MSPADSLASIIKCLSLVDVNLLPAPADCRQQRLLAKPQSHASLAVHAREKSCRGKGH